MAQAKFKITFVYPDFESIGIEYLMSLSRKYGHKAELVFYRAENPYLALRQKKINFKNLARKIIATRPDLAAFSCVTDNYRYQLRVAKELGEIKPEIKTIFGGVHVTSVPDLVLKESCIDAVAIGEADLSFMDFLKNCRKKGKRFIFPDKEITSIVFKKGKRQIGVFREGKLINLDSLPLPDKDQFIKTLKESRRFRYSIITSRGCPYGCSYCIQSMMHRLRGRRIFRQRSVKKVIEELLWAKKKYHFKIVYFMDDLFTTNKK